MDERSQLDSQLDSIAPTATEMEFPPALVTSLRNRRITRRLKAGALIITPVLLLTVALFWSRPAPLPAPTRTASTIILHDPAALPAETNWQPVRLQRAGGANRLNILDF